MHLSTLLATLSLSSLAVVATPATQQDQQVVFVPEETWPGPFERKPFDNFFQSMEEDPFNAAVRNKLFNKEDFNLEDEKQDEWEEGGVKGKCFQYRAASGRFF